MKHFITILIGLFLVSLVSCEKAFTPDPTDNIETIQYTNSVSYNGDSYAISEFDAYLMEGESEEIFGISEPVFVVEGVGKRLASKTVSDYSEVCTYDCLGFIVVIPVTNYGKVYDLKSNGTYGVIEFATGESIIETSGSHQSLTNKSIKGTVFTSTKSGNTSELFVGDESNSKAVSEPSKAIYYIEIEHTDKEQYKMYVEFIDANGDKYVLSYKGDKEL